MSGFSGVPADSIVVMEGHVAGRRDLLTGPFFRGKQRYSTTRSTEPHITMSTENQEYSIQLLT